MNMSISGVGRNTYHAGTAEVEPVGNDLIIQDLQQKLLQSQASEARLMTHITKTNTYHSQIVESRRAYAKKYYSMTGFGYEYDQALKLANEHERLVFKDQPPNTAELEAYVESEIDKRLGEPELYMAKNLHNKSYATSFSEPEARLFLLQSGLKVDGVESKVIPLYAKKG
jgi:hypothetical protein